MREPKPITIAQLLGAASKPSELSEIIDVRSPAEFTEDHIAGAINMPVLSDDERILIGTLYNEVGAYEAKVKGAALVARNIAHHLETSLAHKTKDFRPLIYCWRGGNRSGAMATVLARIGWRTHLLEGGYREYRRALLGELQTLPTLFQYRVIAGPTGSGKSQILQALQSLGEQVLDLEDLARHKGSVLGNLPHEAQPSQKYFDTLLFEKLRSFDANRIIFIESESKKVGAVQVPEALIKAMRSSSCICIQASMETRIALLLAEYEHFTLDQAHLFKQLDCLTALHGVHTIDQWKALANEKRWPEFVQATLAEHYDPAYFKSMKRNFVKLKDAVLVTLSQSSRDAVIVVAKDIKAHTEKEMLL